jgi:hypothetical protein
MYEWQEKNPRERPLRPRQQQRGQQKRVKAMSLFCYRAVRELGFSLTELARRLGISVAGVGYSVERREIIARENDYQLIE